MTVRIHVSNFRFAAGELVVDAEIEELDPLPGDPPPHDDHPPLPDGFDRDPAIGFSMFLASMNEHGLTPIGVQNHGREIVDALRDTWPELDVYLSPSDAPVWPGFGSLDVTIDSGRGGWSFRPDGVTPYRADR